MPWINNVFLVVQSESQVPKWVNRKTVTVVRHDEFMPLELLPVFNSCAIECFLHKIPGLSPFFIYGNDDMYVLNEIGPDSFFRDYMPLNTLVEHRSRGQTEYEKMMLNTTEFILKKLDIPYEGGFYYSPRHIQNAFSKGVFKRIFDCNSQDILNSVSKFRETKNFSQYFFTDYYMLQTGKQYQMPGQEKTALFDFGRNFEKAFRLFEAEDDHTLVCLNNNDPAKDIGLYHFFCKKFPNKSKYEN